MSMFMLVPLQKVAINPSYNDYFRRKNKKKYLITFHIICLLSVLFIIQKLVFVSVFYYDFLETGSLLYNGSYTASFTLSFSSIGFFIWLFGKYSGVLYPIHSEKYLKQLQKKHGGPSLQTNRSRTEAEMSELSGGGGRRKGSRRDSQMSLTALYAQTPSGHYVHEEDNDGFPDLKLNEPEEIKKQQHSKSMSLQMNKGGIGALSALIPSSKKRSIGGKSNNSGKGKNKSKAITKASSLSQKRVLAMSNNLEKKNRQNNDKKINKWDDAAKAYNLKSKPIELINDNDKYTEDEVYEQQ